MGATSALQFVETIVVDWDFEEIRFRTTAFDDRVFLGLMLGLIR